MGSSPTLRSTARRRSVVDDFGKRHWLMMIGMSLLAIAAMFGIGFALAFVADKFA